MNLELFSELLEPFELFDHWMYRITTTIDFRPISLYIRTVIDFSEFMVL